MKKTLPLLLSFMLLLVGVLSACSNNGAGKAASETGGNASSSASSTSASSSTTSKSATSSTSSTAADYGDTGGLKLPLVSKPVTLTWMVASDNPHLNNSLFVKEIEKRTGITLNVEAYPVATYKDKLQAVVASGKLPDIFFGLPLSQINQLGDQGVLTPINKYLNELPNFKNLYVDNAKNSWVMKSYSDDKGNMFTWPIYGVNRAVNHGFLYRKDIFDKNHIPLWTNTDQFYQDLKKLKQIYPNSYPYASKTQDNIFNDWGWGWGVSSDLTKYPAYYDEQDKQWKLAFTQPQYKNMLDFMKKLYNEKLIDPEFLTDTSASWTAKMTTNNSSFVTFDWIGVLDTFYNQVKKQNPNYDLEFGNPVGPTNQITSLSDISMFGIVVTNNSKKDAALKLLDYLSSPSGAELEMMGVKGQSFTEDTSGKITYPGLGSNPSIKDLEDKYGLWVEGMYLRADKKSVYFNLTPKEQKAQDMMVGKMAPLDPVLKFTDQENKTISDLYDSIYRAGIEFSTKYILNKNYGEKQWQDWLQEAKKLGEDKYIAQYNEAQKRYDGQ